MRPAPGGRSVPGVSKTTSSVPSGALTTCRIRPKPRSSVSWCVTLPPATSRRASCWPASAGREQVALPLRELVAAVERDAADGDRRRPVQHGVHHAGRLGDGGRRHRRAVVVHAVGGHRPAVVLALLDHVQLVAAARAVLARPQRAGRRIDVEALRVAVAVAPDRLHRAGRVHERVVLRRRAVVVDAVDLAVRALEVLRRVEVAAVPDRVVEMLVLVPEEAGAEVGVVGPVEILRGLEQRLLLDEGVVLDLAADDAGGRRALGACRPSR